MNISQTAETIDVRESILDNGQRIIAGKGFSAVGINEILTAAGVPKGSFYHYFGSKDAFGVALLEYYFEDYFAHMDAILNEPGLNMAQRLMGYWKFWQDNQLFYECQGKCLAVKLGAEVSDLSEPMRLALKQGTAGIIDRLACIIEGGAEDGSVAVDGTPMEVARSLYQLWMGASVMVKITRAPQPFETAITATRQMLHLTA
ncbi:TetR/AcrR family transcriptional regulator [Pseudomonas azerbaijanoccidentalis]